MVIMIREILLIQEILAESLFSFAYACSVFASCLSQGGLWLSHPNCHLFQALTSVILVMHDQHFTIHSMHAITHGQNAENIYVIYLFYIVLLNKPCMPCIR